MGRRLDSDAAVRAAFDGERPEHPSDVFLADVADAREWRRVLG